MNPCDVLGIRTPKPPSDTCTQMGTYKFGEGRKRERENRESGCGEEVWRVVGRAFYVFYPASVICDDGRNIEFQSFVLDIPARPCPNTVRSRPSRSRAVMLHMPCAVGVKLMPGSGDSKHGPPTNFHLGGRERRGTAHVHVSCGVVVIPRARRPVHDGIPAAECEAPPDGRH